LRIGLFLLAQSTLCALRSALCAMSEMLIDRVGTITVLMMETRTSKWVDGVS